MSQIPESNEPNHDAYGAAYLAYQLQKSGLRRWVRNLYIQKYLQYCVGPTIDFGCGPGVVLEQLPPGSIGFDVNPLAIKYCRSRGLSALDYAPEEDRYRLLEATGKGAQTFFCAHVLEHLDDPQAALHQLVQAAQRLGIQRLVFVVPGRKGFASDATHRTFIDAQFFKSNASPGTMPYTLTELTYFPGPWKNLGTIFVYHELIAVYTLTQRA